LGGFGRIEGGYAAKPKGGTSEMKATVNLEIDKEDLNYELKELIAEIASSEVTRLVRETAQKMVEEEVKKIVGPIVDKYLETALVGREFNYHEKNISKRPVDEYIQCVINKYLSEPVYHYSKTSNDLSKKYMPSSSGGEKKTRAEQWVTEKAQQYVDNELFAILEAKLNEVAKHIIPSEERIQEIIKAEMKRMVG